MARPGVACRPVHLVVPEAKVWNDKFEHEHAFRGRLYAINMEFHGIDRELTVQGRVHPADINQ